jgi:broad specificity phosphatase PhoE
MARIYMVRHGEAAARWGEDADPGLSEAGREQAAAMAADLARLGPMALLTSPLRRAQETAVPLARSWAREAAIDPAVAEVPAPDIAMGKRQAWLRGIMAGTWAEADGDGNAQLRPWREGIAARLTALPADTVVVSHFVVINVAVGAATGDDRVVVFRPDYCSVTVLDSDGDGLRLVELGREAETVVR